MMVAKHYQVMEKPGGAKKDAQYCCKHKPVGYVDVISKRCIYDGCETLPSYGKTRRD